MPSDNKTFMINILIKLMTSFIIPSHNKTFYDKYSNKINDIIYYAIT